MLLARRLTAAPSTTPRSVLGEAVSRCGEAAPCPEIRCVLGQVVRVLFHCFLVLYNSQHCLAYTQIDCLPHVRMDLWGRGSCWVPWESEAALRPPEYGTESAFFFARRQTGLFRDPLAARSPLLYFGLAGEGVWAAAHPAS